MNKEELEKVEQLIEQKDSEQLKDLLAGLHPADIAELCNELDAEEARFIYCRRCPYRNGRRRP